MGKPKLYHCTNTTRQTLLGDKIRKADNYLTRLLGLLPKKSLEPGEGLWIVPCNEIHSIGMRFLFDAVFLDKDNRVVHLIERMKPLRVCPIIRKAKTVLELDAGVIAATATQMGDQLAFEPHD